MSGDPHFLLVSGGPLPGWSRVYQIHWLWDSGQVVVDEAQVIVENNNANRSARSYDNYQHPFGEGLHKYNSWDFWLLDKAEDVPCLSYPRPRFC
jgi:hypothetical protein